MPYIFSFNERSKGAKQLSRVLGPRWRRIVHRNSQFHGNLNPWIVNWGSEEMEPHILKNRVINHPDAVAQVSDKVSFFELILGNTVEQDESDDLLTPPFTPHRDLAQIWMEQDDSVSLVCRTLRRGHGGAGIVIADTPSSLVPAPLYTLYIKKQAEFRVHVFDGEIIDVQKKKRRHDVPNDAVDWRIRNYSNGFIYAREDIIIPPAVRRVALECMGATMLDFGAVDVIWNDKQQRAYVLEINSAPGLEGQTLMSYRDAIRRFTGN